MRQVRLGVRPDVRPGETVVYPGVGSGETGVNQM